MLRSTIFALIKQFSWAWDPSFLTTVDGESPVVDQLRGDDPDDWAGFYPGDGGILLDVSEFSIGLVAVRFQDGSKKVPVRCHQIPCKIGSNWVTGWK